MKKIIFAFLCALASYDAFSMNVDMNMEFINRFKSNYAFSETKEFTVEFNKLVSKIRELRDDANQHEVKMTIARLAVSTLIPVFKKFCIDLLLYQRIQAIEKVRVENKGLIPDNEVEKYKYSLDKKCKESVDKLLLDALKEFKTAKLKILS